MKHAICVALCVAYASGVGAQSEEAAATAPSSASPAGETKYMLLHKEGDPRFITSIQRLGRCEVPGDAHSGMRIPWQLYPNESKQRGEEGKVIMELKFSSDGCVRRATVVQSSGFWRLDEVSLKFTMAMKQIITKETPWVRGEPTIILPIAWRLSTLK